MRENPLAPDGRWSKTKASDCRAAEDSRDLLFGVRPHRSANRCRQDNLGLERSFQTHDWSVRVNFTLLGMIVVVSWLLHTGAMGPLQTMLQNEFYESLALELIDNNFDSVGLRARTVQGSMDSVLTPSSILGPHATPTKRRKKTRDGAEISLRAKKDCCECGKRTTKVFTQCRDESAREVFVCDSSKGRVCFSSHMRSKHS
jgi:hypothetical protein